MIRTSYVAQLSPPAPFVSVTLRNPLTGAEQRDVPAQIDTAADRTLLPAALVQSLSLPHIGTIAMKVVGGITQTMPLYAVDVILDSMLAQTFEVVANAGEPWILLGRDIMNAHRMLLDGPQLFLEIG